MNIIKKIFLCCMMLGSCLFAYAQEDDFVLPGEEDDIEVDEADTLALTEEEIMASWTPEERWLYGLRRRLDNVLEHDRYGTQTVTTGKGKKARTEKKTVKRGYRVGVNVYDLTADSVIYSVNEHDLFIPASNQKLFVSIAALSTLGSDYNFETDIYTDGGIETDIKKVPELQRDTVMVTDSTYYVEVDTVGYKEIEREYLKGNVYVQGGFDPTLNKDAIDYVVGKLMALDVDSIDGVVYGYEPQRSQVSGSWFWDKHPSRNFPSLLHKAMRENGIVFTKPNAYAAISSPRSIDAQLVTSLGTSLISMLRRMMKSSDNYYAESMLLNLLDLRDTDHWTYSGCCQEVRDMVTRAGGLAGEYTIMDGSGLSHGNKASPTTLTSILRYAYHDKSIFEPLWETLPIAGVDGTLGRRMKGTAAYRNVRAKTGTVSGVSTLSGYVTAPNGHFLAFSILVNSVSSSTVGRHLQDLLCIEMAR